MSAVHVVVLAAGKGTRMKSDRPKVLHPVAGLALIDRVLDTATALGPATLTLVIGHGADAVRVHLAGRAGVGFAVQDPPLGTAHALQQADAALSGHTGTVVLLSGDVPLLRAATLERLLDAHRQAGAAATVLTGVLERPYGYGRIVRDAEGAIIRIVEERDATRAEREIQEINSGIWAFDLAPLFDALRSIAAENAQGEFYLTDLVGIYRRRGAPVATLTVDDAQEIRGINSRTELAEVSHIVRQQKNEELMAAGVTIIDPATTYVDDGVEVGADTVLHPGVVLEGRTRVGVACEIQAWVRIHDSDVGDRVTVRNFSVVTGARIDAGAAVGPFAHLRPGTAVGEAARVGNFVELKQTTLGAGSKANHLASLGDAVIGAGVNVGAGAITCNYDGAAKHQTIVEDGAFIGSDAQLVAPVRVGAGAYVASGATVRRDVPPGALAVSAGPQRNIEGWADKRRAQKPKTGV
jgi:bifunctional UDP-N-acetylglucosamine pyrophosphorylase/glucosamine-1-phosphate N-acetyltransferase